MRVSSADRSLTLIVSVPPPPPLALASILCRFNLHVPEWAGVRGELDLLLRSSSPDVSASGSLSSSQLLSGAPAGSSSTGSLAKESPVTSGLVQLDVILRNAKNPAQYVLIERWNVQHERHLGSSSGGGDLFQSGLLPSQQNAAAAAASRKADAGSMYKKLLLLVRSVYTFVKLLPAHNAWKLAQLCLERREACAFTVGHQLSSSEKSLAALVQTGQAPPSAHGGHVLTPVFDQSPAHFTFNSVATPTGRFTLSVFYRPELHQVDFLQAAGIAVGSISARTSLVRVISTDSATSGSGAGTRSGSDASAVQFAGGGTIISDYMSAPETSRTSLPQQQLPSNDAHNDNSGVGSSHQYAQQQPQSSQSQQPKSALAWGLEQQKQKREHSGTDQYQSQESLSQQQQYASSHAMDRRHTLPPNQPLFPQDQPNPYAESAAPHPRTDRAQSVFHAGGGTTNAAQVAYGQHGQPILYPSTHPRSRADSDSSDSAVHSAAGSSKPMSIPRATPTQTAQFAASSMPPSHGRTPSQGHVAGTSVHSPSSDPPSFTNSFTPPVHSTPHSYGSSIGATAYSPFGPTGMHLSQQQQAASGITYNHSGSNLERLTEEDADDRRDARGRPYPAQQLYDHTPSASSHHLTHSHSRLPHSHSQPTHLVSPSLRPASASGSLPTSIPPSNSNSPSSASSRRNSGTSPIDLAIFRNKPPLGHTPATNSSRAHTQTSTFTPTSPAMQPSTIVIRERDAAQSPFAGAHAGRFSSSSAAAAFPPPVLGTSSPAEFNPVLSGSSNQHHHAHAHSYSHSRSHSPGPSPLLAPTPGASVIGFNLAASGTGPSRQLAASPQSRPLSSPSISPNTTPSVQPFNTTRAIPIPKSNAVNSTSGGSSAVGSLFGRTPPFASAGSSVPGSGGGGAGSFIHGGSSVTALGLMKQSSSVSASPPFPTSMVPGASGDSHHMRGGHVSGSWHAADLMHQPIQLNVAPFKQPAGRRSVSSSPAIGPMNPRVQIATGFDLGLPMRAQPPSAVATPTSANATTGAEPIDGKVSIVPTPTTPVQLPLAVHSTSSATLPYEPSGFASGFGVGTGDESDHGDAPTGDGEASLGQFLSYITNLQQQQQPMNLFLDGDDSTSGSPIAVSGSTSSSQMSAAAASAIRQTTVQSLFEQMDRLAASNTFQSGTAVQTRQMQQQTAASQMHAADAGQQA